MPSAAQGTRAQLPFLLTRFWLSARRQRRRLARILRRLDQKLGRRDTKCFCQSCQGIGRDVFRTALDAPNISAIDICGQCEPLLRQAALDTELAEIPANDLADVHCPQESNTNGLTIDGPIVPYFNGRGLHESCALRGK